MKLSSQINVVNIFPNETIKYNKETQTVNTYENSGNDSSFFEENESTDDCGSDFTNNYDSDPSRSNFKKSKAKIEHYFAKF